VIDDRDRFDGGGADVGELMASDGGGSYFRPILFLASATPKRCEHSFLSYQCCARLIYMTMS
jgi:hypothetical protein